MAKFIIIDDKNNDTIKLNHLDFVPKVGETISITKVLKISPSIEERCIKGNIVRINNDIRIINSEVKHTIKIYIY